MLQMHAIIISLNLIVLTGIKWQQLQICCRLHTEKVQNGKAALQSDIQNLQGLFVKGTNPLLRFLLNILKIRIQAA